MERYNFREANDVLAARSFINKFNRNGFRTDLILKDCSLYNAIYSLLLPENRKKMLILHFNNPETEFSRNFCSLLCEPVLQVIMYENFDLLGWDVQDDSYREDMISALISIEGIRSCVEILNEKKPAVFFIALIDMHFEVILTLTTPQSRSDFQDLLMDSVHSMQQVFETKETIVDHEDTDQIRSVIDFQQEVFQMLSDRDYDRYRPDELQFLKQKINFALVGPPKEVDEKESEETSKLFDLILAQNNEFSEFKDEVAMSIVYNCLLPLESKNPREYAAVPVFILRKCREADNPCRIIIDHSKRVYKSWRDYLEDNKLDQCLMTFPKDGRYSGDAKGNVILNKAKSPACKLSKKLMKATDVTSAVLGVGSSGVMVAAAVPAIAVAPVALTGALAVGIGVGAYSIARSIGTLIDRGKHKESFSIKEAEARGAYLNIAAGTAGFAAAGASAVVSKMAASGSSVGMATKVTANTLGVANIGISGLAVGNSSTEILIRWIKHDEKPSPLALLQLSTSILFFSHAVYSFKTANTIIEENQTSVLKSFKESLRSNRHRKMFNKLELETTRLNNGNIQKGRAEVISSVIRLKNKDEIFAFLTSSNKRFNKLGIRFDAKDGHIMLNGIKPLDLVEISKNVSSDVYSYFADLPQKPLDQDLSSIFDFKEFGIDFLMNVTLRNIPWIPWSALGEKMLTVCKKLLEAKFPILDDVLKKFRELRKSYPELINTALSFIRKEVENLLERSQKNYINDPLNFLFENLINLKKTEKKQVLIEIVCDYILQGLRSEKFVKIVSDFASHVEDLIISIVIKESEEQEHEDNFLNSNRLSKKRKACEICSGYFFQ